VNGGTRHTTEAHPWLAVRCRVGLVCWFDRGRLHTEVLRHPLPDRVEFAEFYARPSPGGDLVVGLGRSRRGWVWCDLAQLPHLLVGGISGGGKSVFLRQLLTWLVLTNQPSRLKLVLLDFKSSVELLRFGRLPHALHEAVTETQDAEFALRHVVAEIDRRMGVLAAAQVVDLDAWDVGNGGESRDERGTRLRSGSAAAVPPRPGHLAGRSDGGVPGHTPGQRRVLPADRGAVAQGDRHLRCGGRHRSMVAVEARTARGTVDVRAGGGSPRICGAGRHRRAHGTQQGHGCGQVLGCRGGSPCCWSG